MQVIILAKTSPESESQPAAPNPDGMEAISRFHEELTAAGILLGAGRLHPSSKGARARFKGASRHVTDGPFLEAKELVGGYWIWQVRSLDEAIEWLKRAPFDGGDFEIREIYEQAEFGDGLTPGAARSDAAATIHRVDYVPSRDGTRIAYDRVGDGPALIFIGGALSDRAAAAPLAALLAPHFTAFAYDRRGRGDSGDTQPFTTQREIEDLDALIGEAGGTALVFGHSSGAALALQAVRQGLAIPKLAMYEPPYIVDDSRPPLPSDYNATVQALVAAGRRADAVECFWRVALQMPPEAIAWMRNGPMWPGIEALGPHAPL